MAVLETVLSILAFIVFVVIGLAILILIVGSIILFLPAAIIAFVAWLLTGDLLLAGVIFDRNHSNDRIPTQRGVRGWLIPILMPSLRPLERASIAGGPSLQYVIKVVRTSDLSPYRHWVKKVYQICPGPATSYGYRR